MVRGDRIYNLRTARGYTLQELGDKIGVTASTVRKWESGVIETIRSDKINKLAKALDVTPGYLLDWTNKPIPYEPTEISHGNNFYHDLPSNGTEIALFYNLFLQHKKTAGGIR